MECPPWGVFLRDPIPYLREFRRKPQKTPNGQVDKSDQRMNLAIPVYQFLSAAASGAKDGHLTSMPYPVFEPGTFGVAAGSPSHYTAWSAFVCFSFYWWFAYQSWNVWMLASSWKIFIINKLMHSFSFVRTKFLLMFLCQMCSLPFFSIHFFKCQCAICRMHIAFLMCTFFPCLCACFSCGY